MFQPKAKLEFIRRNCLPTDHWQVCVDIDASEEGRTGGPRKGVALDRQKQMQAEAKWVRDELTSLGVQIGQRRRWCTKNHIEYLPGDPDIIAYREKTCLIAEIEAKSSGQPEQKLYKAVGQIIRTASDPDLPSGAQLVVVVQGDEMARHLGRMTALKKLGIGALALALESSTMTIRRKSPSVPDGWYLRPASTSSTDAPSPATAFPVRLTAAVRSTALRCASAIALRYGSACHAILLGGERTASIGPGTALANISQYFRSLRR